MKKTDAIKEKIYRLPEFRSQVLAWRLKSQSIVLTYGVFDVLHAGNITLLNEAAKEGDRLIVALNADNTVKKSKGPARPLTNQEDRALIIASLVMVDAVVIYDEDTPLELIKTLQPDVLVKGGEFHEKEIEETTAIQNSGSKVVFVPLKEGYSTADMIKKIRQ